MVPERQGAERLLLVMVGLPARGKTFVARKLQRYLSWIGYRTSSANVGDVRRARVGARQPAEYFAPGNAAASAERMGFARAALDELVGWIRRGGEVGIYDATNTERERRAMVREACAREGISVLFVETSSQDERLVDEAIRRNKVRLPDYEGVDPEVAFADFRARIAHYESVYEPVGDDEGPYVKIFDHGRKVHLSGIEGQLAARLAFFLTNVHPTDRPIWLSRHGESAFNVLGRIGGDAPLTERGERYARALAELAARKAGPPLAVWTSTLGRTVATAACVSPSPIAWRALDEIDAGVCDGMTYEEIRLAHPGEFAARAASKFEYRYPRGESYADVIRRLEPLVVALERQREPVLVIAHQAILRGLYGYLVGRPREECPYLPVPLHTVIQLAPTEDGYDETRVALAPG